ncbi:MAG: MacB family efflux pump subunit [Bdellovibrionales bacterium]
MIKEGDPLLELKGLSRQYGQGQSVVRALDDVNLTVNAGEMLAIVGASGSGKSTMLNILGCLDKPTSGQYIVAGQDTSTMSSNELARLRREYFGFIFQRYHLLNDHSAIENVAVPAVYAGIDRTERLDKAAHLLEQLGLKGRESHKPNELSGGQQQRVSIARSLMNGGSVILADEPTGALDSHSGQDMLKLLEELHKKGHTIIIVTHDMSVAEHAERVIEIKDGRIIADRETKKAEQREPLSGSKIKSFLPQITEGTPFQKWRDSVREALWIALLSMVSHRMRTLLTMLGIIIGIASVVSVVALGEGSQQQILKDISAMGTNTLNIYPGKGFGDRDSQKVHTLVPADATALAQQSYIDSATPVIGTSVTLRYQNVSASARVRGVGEQYFQVRDLSMDQGVAFDQRSVKRQSQEVVIDENTKKQFFGTGVNPVGKVIFLGSVPCRIIGVLKTKESGIGNDENLNVYVPYTTAMTRLIGQRYLQSIMVRLNDDIAQTAAEEGIVKLLTARHRAQDVYVFNTTNIRKTIESATSTMRLLTGMIAVISLIVGGIGVMNIMLVSVTERTREIGVRMAVGACQRDIMTQFLIEAVLVCCLAGFIGVLTALGFGQVFATFNTSFSMIFSPLSIVAAFACSTLIGIVFGFLPARNAARLDPIDALARE